MSEYGPYFYQIFWCEPHQGWRYEISSSEGTRIKSKECFETKQEAEFAAVGHISLLEFELTVN